MKKSLLLIALLSSLSVIARDFTYKGLVYTVTNETAKLVETKAGYEVTDENNKTTIIPGNPCSDIILMLPSKVYDGDREYTVTRIGEKSFANLNDLEILYLPDGLMEIGDDAFRTCLNLAGVRIPDEVHTIGKYAFGGCIRLGVVNMSNSLEYLEDGAFALCLNLTNITLPESLLRIGTGAFISSGLEEIVIPNKVSEIDAMAFYSCSHLTTVYLPTDLLTLGLYAFDESNAIKDIYYPTTSPVFGLSSTFTDETYTNATLHVAKDMKSAMEASYLWSNFVNIVEDSDSGIDNILEDLNISPEYYNLNGMRITNPNPGQTVIRRTGNKYEKVIF